MKCLAALLMFAVATTSFQSDLNAEDDGKLRIIAFGAHPDDCEFQMAGTAAKYAQLGHHVKLVSVTNGDIGHWRMAGGPLAQRRTAEVQEAARRIGTTAEVLDIHDGELLPTLDNRQKITRLIREWNADLVIAHRPNDYHPDHRYTGVLVQDSAYMVAVPFFCPDTPPLKRNPVFMYFPDNFEKPNPFKPDVIVSIDDVFEKKMDAVDALVSQVYEGGALGSEETLRQRHADNPIARREWATDSWQKRQGRIADKHRAALIDWYGEEEGKAVKYAEAFEICEYGRQPNREELKKLFPFFGD
ncbi:MAG: PIG-L family deacetylase [Planctomycetaceae bacterium]|nr:PIG-L family deacetylase [Planctomycetaceae bacterium]MCB9939286.1 PIG-L family deacetylase [Planctomycetaceae bacterium]HRX81333.1 PIG-L family deacetylase [Pirellulaceae bacterium]